MSIFEILLHVFQLDSDTKIARYFGFVKSCTYSYIHTLQLQHMPHPTDFNTSIKFLYQLLHFQNAYTQANICSRIFIRMVHNSRLSRWKFCFFISFKHLLLKKQIIKWAMHMNRKIQRPQWFIKYTKAKHIHSDIEIV